MDKKHTNLINRMMKVKGGDFPKFYESLTKLEKAEYKIILERLSEKFNTKK